MQGLLTVDGGCVGGAKAGGWQTVGRRMEAIDHSLSARHSTYTPHVVFCVLHFDVLHGEV